MNNREVLAPLITLVVAASHPHAGFINAELGLKSWSHSREHILRPGVDVVFLGDSYFVNGSDTRYVQSLVNLFKVYIQNRLNPSGTSGGYGFSAACEGGPNTSYTTGTYDVNGPVTLTSSLDASDQYASWSTFPRAEGTGLRHIGLGSGSNKAVIFRMNGTLLDHASRRYNATHFQVVYRRQPNGLRFQVDAGTDVVPGRGQGIPSTWINTAGPQKFGVRSSVYQIPDRTKANMIAVRGDTTGAGRSYFDGVIFYDGDLNRGVRVHDLSNIGVRLDYWNLGSLLASIAPWGSGGNSGNAKLFVISCIANEAKAYWSVDRFAKALKELTTKIKDLDSKPDILYFIPFKPKGLDPAQSSGFDNLREALIALAYEQGSAVFDLPKLTEDLGLDLRPENPLLDQGGSHLNPRGHQLVADRLCDELCDLLK